MPRPSGGLWGHRDFLFLWSGQSISVFGSLVGRIALPMLVVLVLDATPLQVSLVRALEVAPGLLVGLFAGVWVDRVRRRPLMLWADVARALLMGAIPVLSLAGSLTLRHIYAVAFLVSIFTILFDVAYQSYVPTLVRSDQLVEANSKLEASASVAEITAFGIAGFLVQMITAPITLLVDAVSFLGSALSLALIRRPEPTPPRLEAQTSVWTEMREGARVLLRNPVLRALVGADAISSLFGNMIGSVYMLFVLRELQLSPGLSGMIFALGGISALGGAVLAGPLLRRFGLAATIIAASALTVMGSALVPLAGGPLVVVVLFLCAQQLIGDGGHMVAQIQMTSLRQAITPPEFLGRVNATNRVSDWTFQLMGTLLGGVLGEIIGLRGTLGIAVAGKSLAVLWLWLSPVRSYREMPEAAAREA